MSGTPLVRVTANCMLELEFVQYVKQETLIQTESGKEARATRLITEHASQRIGKMAFELALARPRKVLVTSPFTRVP